MKKTNILLLLALAGIVGIGTVLFCFPRNEITSLYEPELPTSVSFSWWGNDERHMYTLNGLDLFEEKYPNLEVQRSYSVWDIYEKRNRISMKSETETDVMQINFSWLKEYSPDGEGYYDLNQLSDVIDFSQFTEEDLQMGTVNGHLNGIPIAYNCSIMCFNKEIYDAYDLDIPKTWEDLFQAAEVMSKDGMYPLGAVKKHLFLMIQAYYEQTTGNTLFDEEGHLIAGDEDLKILLDFYRELLEQKVLMPIDSYNTNTFGNRAIAGAAFWISDATRYCQKLQEEGTEIVLADPIGIHADDVTGWYMKPATLYAVSANTEVPKEAGILLNFLANDPDMAVLQGTEKGVPVSASAYQALEEQDQLNSLESEATSRLEERKEDYALFLPIMEDNEIINGFKQIGDKYVYGQQGLEECVHELRELIQSREK